MKIYKSIGSKERFLEMYCRVNKLNEDFESVDNTKVILDNSFNLLKNNQLKINNTHTQVEGDISYVEFTCTDENNNKIIFSFEASSSENELDGVYNVDDVILKSFKFESPDNINSFELNEESLKEFNSMNSDEFFNLIDKEIDVEDDFTIDDELYEEIIKKIDSYPFGGGSERLQTGINYVDNKPTNQKLRVKSPELEKIIDEDADYLEMKDDFSDGGEKEMRTNSSYLRRDTEFTKMASAYESLLKLKKGELKSDNNIQRALASIRDAIVYYLNTDKNLDVDSMGVQNYFENTFKNLSSVVENEKEDKVTKLAKDKEEVGDLISGGLADNKSPLKYDPDQVLMGMEIEMEHTDNPMIALEISIDHLQENPKYYDYLDKMEKDMKDSPESSNNEDVLSDVLLGYKPKNVGDEIDEAYFTPEVLNVQPYSEIKDILKKKYMMDDNLKYRHDIDNRIEQAIKSNFKSIESAKNNRTPDQLSDYLFKYDMNLLGLNE